jgi:hypothetical protein
VGRGRLLRPFLGPFASIGRYGSPRAAIIGEWVRSWRPADRCRAAARTWRTQIRSSITAVSGLEMGSYGAADGGSWWFMFVKEEKHQFARTDASQWWLRPASIR